MSLFLVCPLEGHFDGVQCNCMFSSLIRLSSVSSYLLPIHTRSLVYGLAGVTPGGIYFSDRTRWPFVNRYQCVSCGAAGQHETLHAAMGDSRDGVGIPVEYRGLSIAFQRQRRY